jgi:pimeloyl-ACP methyl ester carboxylesterase
MAKNFRVFLVRAISGILIPALLIVTACDTQTERVGAGDRPDATVVSADGVPITYEDFGEGSPAIVLVHGWSCDRRYWSKQVGPISVEHRVITLDLGGHGESGFGREDWTIASFGADVAAVIEHLGLDAVVLVGHSMGGDVIFQAARLLPGKVDALIMVDTYKQLDATRSEPK